MVKIWNIEWINEGTGCGKIIAANHYHIDNCVGIFQNKNGDITHSVPADKVIVTYQGEEDDDLFQ